MKIEVLNLSFYLPFYFLFLLTMKIKYFDKLWENTLENLQFFTWIDEYYDYDCTWKDDETVKIDVREHRHYNFLHDFWLDWWMLDEEYEEGDYYYEDWLNEQEKWRKINDEYYVFWLDFFDHSVIAFSLAMHRRDIWYYERDRSRNVGVIAVKKSDWIDFEQAEKIARTTIEDYNSLLNWRVYEWRIEENWDFYDGCTGYYNSDEAFSDWENAVENYLKTKWIKFESFEIVND